MDAVPKKNRISSSDDDVGLTDTSDEAINVHFEDLKVIDPSFVSESETRNQPSTSRDAEHQQRAYHGLEVSRREPERNRHDHDHYSPRPSTSHNYRATPRCPTSEERAEQIVCEAEAAKARILPASGNTVNFMNTATMDENYIIVGSHLDSATVETISKVTMLTLAS